MNESRNVYILLFKFIKLLKTNWLMTTKIHHFPELNHRLSRKVYVTIFLPIIPRACLVTVTQNGKVKTRERIPFVLAM